MTLRIERDRPRAAALWTAATALFLMLASYLAAYLVTPLDLNWHIATSMDRLIVQIWPAMLLTLCALLPPDLDALFAMPSLNRGWAWAGATILVAGVAALPAHPPLARSRPPGTPEDYLNESLKDFQTRSVHRKHRVRPAGIEAPPGVRAGVEQHRGLRRRTGTLR